MGCTNKRKALRLREELVRNDMVARTCHFRLQAAYSQPLRQVQDLQN